MSKVQHCRPAAEVINALLETGETLETLAVKLDTNSFTLSRYNGGVYGNMTSYPTLRKKIEDAYGLDTGLFEPGAEIKLPKTGTVFKEIEENTNKPAIFTGMPKPTGKPVLMEHKPNTEPNAVALGTSGKSEPAPKKTSKTADKKPAQTDEVKPAPEGFMEIPVTEEKKPDPAKAVKKQKPVSKPAPAKVTEAARNEETDDNLPGQLTFGDVFGGAAPKPVENEKPLTYEQMSAKLQSEICSLVKASFTTLKDSHKESMPKKPVFAGKEASELVDIMAKLSTDDIKVLLAMARRMVPPTA
jgi:hypothetical protein